MFHIFLLDNNLDIQIEIFGFRFGFSFGRFFFRLSIWISLVTLRVWIYFETSYKIDSDTFIF